MKRISFSFVCAAGYNHMIGSLKKGSKQSLSLPSTSYNTLPTNRHLRNNVTSPKFISQSSLSPGGSGKVTSPRGPNVTPPSNYMMMNKRSPSSTDSGHSSSNMPASYRSSSGNKRTSSKVQHHTVYLHGEFCVTVSAKQNEKLFFQDVVFSVGSKSGGNPESKLQSFAEESSPENMASSPSIARMMRSTESLDSLSDESNHHSRTPGNRQVKNFFSLFLSRTFF